jgi:hypothetical protein
MSIYFAITKGSEAGFLILPSSLYMEVGEGEGKGKMSLKNVRKP